MEMGSGGVRGSVAAGTDVPLDSDEDGSYFSFNSHSKRTRARDETIEIARAETTLSE